MEPLNRRYEKNRISTMCFGLLILMAATVLADVVFMMLVTFLIPELDGNASASAWLGAAAQYLAGFPLCMIVISMVPKDRMEKSGLGFSGWGTAFLASCSMLFFGNILGYEVNNLLGLLLGRTPANTLTEALTEGSVLCTVLTSVILAPVLEELVFRKMLIDRLNRLGDRPAILLSAILFALFHGNLYQLFYAFGVGLVFGYVYVRTGRIRYTISIHMLVNCLFGVVPAVLLTNANPVLDVVFTIVELVLAVLGIVFLIRSAGHIRLLRGWVALPHFRWGSLAFLNAGMLALLAGCAAMFAVNFIVL